MTPSLLTPPAAAPLAAGRRRSGSRALIQYAPIVAVTFLAKISLPPLGPLGLGIDVPLILAVCLIGMAGGRFRVHTARLLLYLAMLAVLGGTQLLRGEPFSANSLALLAAVFLPLTLELKPRVTGPDDTRAALDALAGLAAFFGVCGVAQYALQFVVGVPAAFPVEHLVPAGFQIGWFNSLIPLAYGSSTLKSNGVFFLEPSFFSQFMALGLLVEVSLRRRVLVILLLTAAIAVSYSGTGLIVAGVGLVGLVVIQRRWDILLVGAVLAVGLVLLNGVVPLGPLVGRAGEFESTRSSGSARFVAWIDMFELQWWPDPWRVLFGAGAGSFPTLAAVARQPTAEMSFSKMLFEFGAVGASFYFLFLIHAMNSVRAPLALRLGLCATLFVNGAYVAFPVGIAASILLWPGAHGPSRKSP